MFVSYLFWKDWELLTQLSFTCCLTAITRESLVTTYVGRVSSTWASDRVVTKSSGCCCSRGPCGCLLSALLSEIISATSGWQEVLAGLESADECVASGTNSLNGTSVNYGRNAAQGTVITASTTNLNHFQLVFVVVQRLCVNCFWDYQLTYTVKNTLLIVDRDAEYCNDHHSWLWKRELKVKSLDVGECLIINNYQEEYWLKQLR